MKSSVSTRGREHIACHGAYVAVPCALVRDACEVAQQNHVLYLPFVVNPVFHEHTRRSRHGEDIGVGSEGVLLDRILLLRFRPLLRVVVFNKCHGITAVVAIRGKSTVVELCPVAVCRGVANGISGGEVECRTLYLTILGGTVYPVFHILLVAVEIFAYRECRLCRSVVDTGEFGVVALNHIVAHSGIPQVVE